MPCRRVGLLVCHSHYECSWNTTSQVLTVLIRRLSRGCSYTFCCKHTQTHTHYLHLSDNLDLSVYATKRSHEQPLPVYGRQYKAGMTWHYECYCLCSVTGEVYVTSPSRDTAWRHVTLPGTINGSLIVHCTSSHHIVNAASLHNMNV